jgi:hypothetical protein
MYIPVSLSVLKSPGAEAQVNELRKVSIKLSKALNLEGNQINGGKIDTKEQHSTVCTSCTLFSLLMLACTPHLKL